MLLSSGAGMGASGPGAAAGGLLSPPVTCSLYGPEGLRQYVHAFKPYVNQEQTLDVQEVGAEGSAPVPIKRSFLTITPLIIKPLQQQVVKSGSSVIAAAPAGAASTGAIGDEEPSAKRIKIEAQQDGTNPEPGSSCGTEQQMAGISTTTSQGGALTEPRWPGTADEAVAEKEAVAYVCEFAGTPGKFDPKRAEALGLKPGPVSHVAAAACVPCA